MKTNPAAGALLAALCAIPSAYADITYFDDTMATANWQTVVLEKTPKASFTVNGVASFGNLFAIVNTGFTATQGQTTESVNIAQIRPAFTWNPAVDGSLDSMDFSLAARHNGSFGFSSEAILFYRPVVLQNGRTYSVLSSSLQPPNNNLLNTLSWNFTDASNWANFENQSLRPDFSAGGAPIQFGYRAQTSASCTLPSNRNCNNAGSIGFVDDYRVVLRAGAPVSSVPEPGTWAMLATAGLAAAARRAGASRNAV